MKVHKLFKLAIILVVLLTIFLGCKEKATKKENVVSGTIYLADGNSLENMIRAIVTIEDISIADIGSVKVSEVIISPIEELPIQFSIPYNVTEIRSSRRYSIRAEVIELNENGEEERAYLTTLSYPILTGGFGSSVSVLVERVN